MIKFRKLQLFSRPLHFLMLYVALIPLFATLYTVFTPNSFVHSNLELEASFSEDRQKNLERIREEIKSILKSQAKPVDGLILIDVGPVSYQNDAFTYELQFTYYLPIFSRERTPLFLLSGLRRGEDTRPGLFSCETTFRSWDGSNISPAFANWKKSSTHCDLLGIVNNLNLNLDLNDFFFPSAPLFTAKVTREEADILIKAGIIKDEEGNWLGEKENRIDDLLTPDYGSETQLEYLMGVHIKLAKGVYTGASWGLFGRMFYFSAVTITTLGFGDIAPVSSTARFLVTLESILGIVLIGLFFNSIANNISASKSDNGQALK